MSTPNPYQPSPGGFVPPGSSYSGQGQPSRPRQGCWLWGCITLVALMLIFAAVIAIFSYKFVKTGAGKEIFAQAYKAQDCKQKMGDVHDAIMRYHERTGQYPPTLAALAPSYLDADKLHCTMDKNSSPTHPTFAYKQPPAGTSANAAVPMLSFHLLATIKHNDSMNQTLDFEYIECVNGAPLQNQTQTFRKPDGTIITQTHTGTNATLGPGSTGE